MAVASGYDAFISYSHQHDGQLGPALQAGLTRFAKPWYKLRALRIFRDTANLSANPSLWASIEDGLNSSRWLILLASTDAAQSEWVNREVRHWLAHRSPDRLLVVGTDSGLAWDEQRQDWAADAPVPPALRGAFSAEPLWVDLSDMRLDARRPTIPPDRIAAVAAPIRGVPKDTLVGEDIRLHRRTVRLASGAVAIMAVLTVLAVVASFIAYGQRNAAIQQRDQAIANQVTIEANQLAATNQSLSAQLEVAANQISPTPNSKSSLLDAATSPLSSPLPGPTGSAGIDSVAYSPDGRILAGASGREIWLWNPANGAQHTPCSAVP
jgi:hypothetical protein